MFKIIFESCQIDQPPDYCQILLTLSDEKILELVKIQSTFTLLIIFADYLYQFFLLLDDISSPILISQSFELLKAHQFLLILIFIEPAFYNYIEFLR